jgi:hypothetical protein
MGAGWRGGSAGHPVGVTTLSLEVGPRRDVEAEVDLSDSGALNTTRRALALGAALGTRTGPLVSTSHS